MRCRFEGHVATKAEWAILDAWLVATNLAGACEIVVEEHAVLVHGTNAHRAPVTGTAFRHGDLDTELTMAITRMRGQTKPALAASAAALG
ncbi:MAG: hypothetical protein ABI894_05475 [Ilumatobacteraceae bacterium]